MGALEKYISLIQQLLESRTEKKLLIGGLCDRGSEILKHLEKVGPKLITYLEGVEDYKEIGTQCGFGGIDSGKGDAYYNGDMVENEADSTGDGYLEPISTPTGFSMVEFKPTVQVRSVTTGESSDDTRAYQSLGERTRIKASPSNYEPLRPARLETSPRNQASQELRSARLETSPRSHASQLQQQEDEESGNSFSIIGKDNMSGMHDEWEDCTDVDRLKRQNADLMQRLSKELGDKVSSDVRNLENVTIKNRPINVASEYISLCSSSWLDAKNELDQHCKDVSESQKLRFLCKILTTSYKLASEMHSTLTDRLQQTLTQPLTVLAMWDKINEGFQPQNPEASLCPSDEKCQLPDHVSNALSDCLRLEADKVSYFYLTEAIKSYLLKRTGSSSSSRHLQGSGSTAAIFVARKEYYSNKAVQKYIEQCALLTWKMVIQRPKMSFDKETGINCSWRSDHQEVYFSSDDPGSSKSVVEFYVHPSLKHADALMVKGRVYVVPGKG